MRSKTPPLGNANIAPFGGKRRSSWVSFICSTRGVAIFLARPIFRLRPAIHHYALSIMPNELFNSSEQSVFSTKNRYKIGSSHSVGLSAFGIPITARRTSSSRSRCSGFFSLSEKTSFLSGATLWPSQQRSQSLDFRCSHSCRHVYLIHRVLPRVVSEAHALKASTATKAPMDCPRLKTMDHSDSLTLCPNTVERYGRSIQRP